MLRPQQAQHFNVKRRLDINEKSINILAIETETLNVIRILLKRSSFFCTCLLTSTRKKRTPKSEMLILGKPSNGPMWKSDCFQPRQVQSPRNTPNTRSLLLMKKYPSELMESHGDFVEITTSVLHKYHSEIYNAATRPNHARNYLSTCSVSS